MQLILETLLLLGVILLEYLENKMNNIVSTDEKKLPSVAEKLVSSRIQEFSSKTDPINRSNSQTTITMMTLTMMNGQSPMRQVRQIMAEINAKKSALAEAQVNYAKVKNKVVLGEGEVADAKRRLNGYRLQSLEVAVENALKDIATLIMTYDSLVATHGIENWTEEDFEMAEARHHVRRGFELLYRNLIECGRAHDSSIEYLQQFGVHVQLALAEVFGYIMAVDDAIKNGDRPTASSIEDFLDAMALKYESCVGEASLRMFGKRNIVNSNIMSVIGES